LLFPAKHGWIPAVNVNVLKFALGILVYLLMGLALAGGILLLIAGKPLLFILAVVGYIVFFGWIGCATQ
jgi:hypothetical protein